MYGFGKMGYSAMKKSPGPIKVFVALGSATAAGILGTTMSGVNTYTQNIINRNTGDGKSSSKGSESSDNNNTSTTLSDNIKTTNSEINSSNNNVNSNKFEGD